MWLRNYHMNEVNLSEVKIARTFRVLRITALVFSTLNYRLTMRSHLETQCNALLKKKPTSYLERKQLCCACQVYRARQRVARERE